LTKIFLRFFSSFNNFLSTAGVATVTVAASTAQKTLKTAAKKGKRWENGKAFESSGVWRR